VSADIAIVTGAASGVGARTVARLAAAGTAVVGIDLEWDAGAPDGAAARVRGDVCSAKPWRHALARSERLGGTPSKLVLNAARLTVGTVLDVSDEELRRVFDVNVFAVALGLRECLPPMIASGGGTVVAVASVAGLVAEQGLSAYCASKGALLQLMRCVAVDHARAGIRANCVCPGAIDTPFFRRHVDAAEDPGRFLREKTDRHPSGRILDPDDVARVVEFLLGDGSVGMNGAAVTVDGALTATFDFQTSAVGVSGSARPP
jgi:NAD(P)-dependent dehydrogenase (short-subunit alcohol dehydrogenase family)